VWKLHVGDALTVAEMQGLELLRRENSRQFDVVKRRQPRSHLRVDEAVNAKRAAVRIGDA